MDNTALFFTESLGSLCPSFYVVDAEDCGFWPPPKAHQAINSPILYFVGFPSSITIMLVEIPPIRDILLGSEMVNDFRYLLYFAK